MYSRLFALFLLLAAPLDAQQTAPDLPFESVPDFLKLPPGANFGEVSGVAVNSKGELADGRTFHDIVDFKRLLLEDQPQIARCLTEKLLTYSLGRRLNFADRTAVREIVAKVERQQYGFRTLLHEVVQSSLFREQ